MTLFHIIVLSLVQGITEFLPISSSGHLILVPEFLGERDQGLMIDVAAHGGSLLAVMLYFYREVIQLFKGFFDALRAKATPARFLFIAIVVATIPGLAIGGFLHFYASELFRHAWIIALTSFIFGILLWWVDYKKPNTKTIQKMTIKSAFLIGCAQILAFIPGTSRSGITMTAARYFGFDRDTSARFSMFLAMPIIGAAVCIYLFTIFKSHGPIAVSADFFVVLGLSFMASILSIHWLLKWLKNHSFMVFAVYRTILAVAIILLLL